MEKIKIRFLGQAGFRFEFWPVVVYIDPYLSDYVAETEGEHLRRQVPIALAPDQIDDATWVLVSHIHLDHCDPMTLGPISRASPDCRFVGPAEVIEYLKDKVSIAAERLVVADEEWMSLATDLRICAIPAAHRNIERRADGALRFVGYLIEFNGRRYYHSGDCSVHEAIVEKVSAGGPVDVAFLPVNECNYYRDKAGIVGNMSVREAFGFAEELKAGIVVPMHFDMFRPNCVYREEILAVYKNENPSFKLIFDPEEV